jgi:hypothetical protein
MTSPGEACMWVMACRTQTWCSCCDCEVLGWVRV